MAMKPEEIKSLILEALHGSDVQIQDLAGDGEHYAAHIVSQSFQGKTRVEQHKMVYGALQGRMGTKLHALSLKTSAPQE